MEERTEEFQLQARNSGDVQAIMHLKNTIANGKHWYIALLEAIGLWKKAEEDYDGRHYCYLIAKEAFDWLLLAERLCLEIDGVAPEQERIDLLFFAKPPLDLSPEEFKKLIGNVKYRAYLNYWYGVIVEEMLVLAVEEEVRKERHTLASHPGEHLEQEVYSRIYGADMNTLLRCFRQERGYPEADSITLTERKEFTYWLFKYRLEHSDKAKIASDTKKALVYLQQQWMAKNHPGRPGDNGHLDVIKARIEG